MTYQAEFKGNPSIPPMYSGKFQTIPEALKAAESITLYIKSGWTKVSIIDSKGTIHKVSEIEYK